MWFKKRVYADAAAATPLSRRAGRELARLSRVYGNPGAIHAEGVAAKKELERARAAVAKAIGAHADEIIFTASGTEANNLAIHGVLKPGSHVITSRIEHPSVLEPLRASGVSLSELPVDTEGLVFPSAVAMAITPETVLASIQLINSEVGTVEPVREISKELKRAKRQILFHVDASQAPLWMELNVEKLGVDLMTLDAQKVLGPKGVGALYIRRGTKLLPQILGGKQEKGLRAATENVAGAGAFAVALGDALGGAEKRAKKMSALRDYLFGEIQKLVPDVVLNGAALAGGKRVANNINVSIPGLDAQMAVVSLDALGVAASTRSACDIGSEEPSHVIKALGVAPDMAGTAIRLTLLPSATRSDARFIAEALKETADRYRRR